MVFTAYDFMACAISGRVLAAYINPYPTGACALRALHLNHYVDIPTATTVLVESARFECIV